MTKLAIICPHTLICVHAALTSSSVPSPNFRATMSRMCLQQAEEDYVYRCILTNDCGSTPEEIVSFYNLRGGKKTFMQRKEMVSFGLKPTSRVKAFVFRFISVPAKWIRTARQYVLNMYTGNHAYTVFFIPATVDGLYIAGTCVLPQVALWGKGMVCVHTRNRGAWDGKIAMWGFVVVR